MTMLVGCSHSSDPVTAGASYFAGLDPAVVREVLTNPDAMGKVDAEPSPTRASLAQGIVENFIECRAEYTALRDWVTTGTKPVLAAMPKPTSPVQPSYDDVKAQHQRVAAAIDAGDPSPLRVDLTDVDGGCGVWIPEKAGDITGPTIADAVKELG
jgi:hypothetical protein